MPPTPGLLQLIIFESEAIDPQVKDTEAHYSCPLQVFNLLLLSTCHFCLSQGWLCPMLRDDRPVQQQNVCSEGDPSEQGVQTTPERQGTTRSRLLVSCLGVSHIVPFLCVTWNLEISAQELIYCRLLADYERDRAAQNPVAQACGEILPSFRRPGKHLHIPWALQSEGETWEISRTLCAAFLCFACMHSFPSFTPRWCCIHF